MTIGIIIDVMLALMILSVPTLAVNAIIKITIKRGLFKLSFLLKTILRSALLLDGWIISSSE